MEEKSEVVLQSVADWVKQKCQHDFTGHDWWHISRVVRLAQAIAQMEKADELLVTLAALLHDIFDEKLVANPQKEQATVRAFLYRQGLSEQVCQKIFNIIEEVSFKGGHNPKQPSSLESKIVQDADRLDALGAIGIARTMCYSGSKGRLIHDPDKQPRENLSLAEYRNGEDTAIMHFYEKLLKLKDLMHTDYAKKLAEQRHQFMCDYLAEFYLEWEGKR
ncbi:HD domain-containing protein [Enterococcus columbae]|uniref:HD domain-containing protein n=1 Tax=Enterococcus columbae DSM 7374 = ATCC 51263 TaxID=1121865 RepID=S1NI87_9ENTE|nr:HD domain-containing protein [Enterococcus columbae]EOT39181.1 hypothetical protein OMW_02058 [Enterococcus columbae DSM 7374 = ATCC 51263]EOW79886.1 hypothetical protein I568_02237 [Enterococcus columbae DSM 7374 = ATCC 51263]OJG24507.1 hypothetical protein RR47_GL000230 [Enterococcus columbae DSM 7374 = ATCC 51263]